MAARRTRSPVMFWLTSRRTSCTWGLVLWCSTSVLPFRESSQARTKEELMAQPYVGEIRMFAGSFPPAGWMTCAGQLLPISENEILFQLIGTTYGGDGESTFNLPDLRGRLPMHQGTGGDGNTYILGESGGVEEVTLTTQQIPQHNHALLGSKDFGAQGFPVNNMLAGSNTVSIYKATAPTAALNAQSVQAAGGSQPHSNMQPYLGINFIISLFGVFPQPN